MPSLYDVKARGSRDRSKFDSISVPVQTALKPPKKLSADELALQAAQSEEARYQELYRPLNQELLRDVDSTRIVDAAKEQATLTAARREGQNTRNLARYGVSADPLAQKELQRVGTLNNAKFYDDAVNQARVDQYERNQTLRGELINIGRGMARSGQNGLADAANNQVARDNANASAKAQNAAARDQFYGQVAGTALMAAMVFM